MCDGTLHWIATRTHWSKWWTAAHAINAFANQKYDNNQKNAKNETESAARIHNHFVLMVSTVHFCLCLLPLSCTRNQLRITWSTQRIEIEWTTRKVFMKFHFFPSRSNWITRPDTQIRFHHLNFVQKYIYLHISTHELKKPKSTEIIWRSETKTSGRVCHCAHSEWYSLFFFFFSILFLLFLFVIRIIARIDSVLCVCMCVCLCKKKS